MTKMTFEKHLLTIGLGAPTFFFKKTKNLKDIFPRVESYIFLTQISIFWIVPLLSVPKDFMAKCKVINKW